MHAIITVLSTMFQWPQGIVVGNLIASAIIGIPAYIHTHLKLRNLHHRLDRYQTVIKSLNAETSKAGKMNVDQQSGKE